MKHVERRYGLSVNYSRMSAYISGADDLSTCLADAVESATFYEELYPGTVTIEIWANCKECDGNGTVPRKGRKGTKFCPSCKGADPVLPVAHFAFKTHPNVLDDRAKAA